MSSNLASPVAPPNTLPQSGSGQIVTLSAFLAIDALLTVLADIAVILRLIIRKWIVKSVGWDDWTIVAATLGNMIGFVLVVVEIHFGFGRHKSEISNEDFISFSKYSYGEWIQTFATLMFTKISICLFLLRIVISKAYIRSLQAIIVILLSSNVILTIIWILQCRPVDLAWIAPKTPLSCFTQSELSKIILAQALISVVSDFVLATYPIFILRKIQAPLRVKVGLCILMGLGVITGAFCIVRTIGNWQNENDDPTWDSITNWWWRSWEVCMGIIIACIPTLRPGYKLIQTKISTYTRAHSSKGTFGRKQSEKTTIKPSEAAATDPLSIIQGATLRPDRGGMNTTCTTVTPDDVSDLPLQPLGIMRTTQVDLESQRTVSGDNLTGSNGFYEVERTDSQARLNKDTGRLV